jgi:hypothetical protein
MTKRIFKLRNVAMIACLAVMTMFSGCDKDNGDYTIKYSPGTHSSGENYSQSKNKGESITLRDATYTRNGFTQTGWSKKEDGSTKDYQLKGTYTDDADITLYPFWVASDVPPDDDDDDYGGEGFFKVNLQDIGLDAAVTTASGVNRISFSGKGFTVQVYVNFTIGNTLPEGTFSIQNLLVKCDNFSGATYEDEIPSTLEIKKLDNGRYEFKVSGDMLYVVDGLEEGVYPYSLYYKSKEYKGPGKLF